MIFCLSRYVLLCVYLQTATYYFENLSNYKNWKPRQKVLDIATKYMKPD